jgi:hypothetical protein
MASYLQQQDNDSEPNWPPRRTELLTIIRNAKTSLQEKKGFGLLRLGDGEGAILAQDAWDMREGLQKSVSIWFGNQEITKHDLRKFQYLLEDSIRGVDVIGLPRPSQISGLDRYAAVMNFMPINIDVHNTIWTDAAVHFYLQWSAVIGELMRLSDRVWIIGCREVAMDLQKITDSPVAQWLVQGEARFPGSVITPHWPTGYEHIQEKIKSNTQPGDLVLIGAGILGKAYVHAACKNGAVALDIGSVIDGWAGVPSRPGRITSEAQFKVSHLHNTYTDTDIIANLRSLLSRTNIKDATI